MKENNNLSVQYYGESDLGLVRTENQDSFGKFPTDSNDLTRRKGLLFIVADGMGGHIGGKEASQLAVKIVSREYYLFSSDVISNCLRYAFKNANIKIHQSSREEPDFRKKGTTCTALVLEQNFGHIAHVGDSRIYKIYNDDIEQLTNDHTHVEEMLKKGIISKEEAKDHPSKSVLVRAMGIEEDIDVDIEKDIPLKVDQYFVLCSDGLARVNKEEIKEMVLSNAPSVACKKLIQLANERGGHDNITVQIIRISNDGEKLESTKKKTTVKTSPKRIKFSLISVALIVILFLGLFFIKDISNLFSSKTILKNETIVTLNVDSIDGNSQTILEKANYCFSIGQFDSALFNYDLILIDNPMHAGALNGKEAVYLEFKKRGDQLVNENLLNDGLYYYKKAIALKPDDKVLKDKIILFEKKNREIPIKKKTDVKKNIKENTSKEYLPSEEIKLDDKRLILSSIDPLEWNLEGLTENDVKVNKDGFTFFNSNKNKKALYNKLIEDIDVEVEIQLYESPTNHKAGIIIGYNKSGNLNKENYYLFCVDNYGNYSLIKLNDDKEEILLSAKQTLDSNKKNLWLKIKCLGPWIMLYNDDKLLESYLSKDFIKGKIGLFTEANAYVDFTSFKISSAFENLN